MSIISFVVLIVIRMGREISPPALGPNHKKNIGESQKSANLHVLEIRHPKSIYPLSMKQLIERKKTVAEVADLLRKTPQVIEQMARRKEIPAFKVGKSWRFDPVDLAAWLQTQKEAQ